MSKRPKISKALRANVWNTYIGETKGVWKCICNTNVSQMNFECAHVVPHTKSGKLTVENLRPLCGSCNKSCATKNLYKFIRDMGLKPEEYYLTDKTPMTRAELQAWAKNNGYKANLANTILQDLHDGTIEDDSEYLTVGGRKVRGCLNLQDPEAVFEAVKMRLQAIDEAKKTFAFISGTTCILSSTKKIAGIILALARTDDYNSFLKPYLRNNIMVDELIDAIESKIPLKRVPITDVIGWCQYDIWTVGRLS